MAKGVVVIYFSRLGGRLSDHQAPVMRGLEVRKDTLRKAPWVIATLISPPGRGGPAQDSP